MNKYIITIMMVITAIGISAQSHKVEPYFTTRDMPNMLKFLPAYPDTNDVGFANDVARYQWGKLQREDNERAAIAMRDAVYGLQTIINEFSEPFGVIISEGGTPHIYRLLQNALATCDSVCTLPKAHYMRQRPYAFYNESTLVPGQEESHRYNGSYPSGHTILGWSAALLMSEINPERQDTLLARGFMYGESRVIAGYHWQSDVDAGRLAASTAYAKLHTSKRFLKEMKLAKKEFQRVKNKAAFAPVSKSSIRMIGMNTERQALADAVHGTLLSFPIISESSPSYHTILVSDKPDGTCIDHVYVVDATQETLVLDRDIYRVDSLIMNKDGEGYPYYTICLTNNKTRITKSIVAESDDLNFLVHGILDINKGKLFPSNVKIPIKK